MFTLKNCEDLHREILKILSEVGIEIGNENILDALSGIGARVDKKNMRVYFPEKMVEEFLSHVPKENWDTRRSNFWGRCGVFGPGWYINPDNNEFVPLDSSHLEPYFKLAKHLPEITECFLTGYPWSPSPDLAPLYERFYCWKYGLSPSGILYPFESAEHLEELYCAYAEMKGKKPHEVFNGGIFMMSPLKISKEEAEQFAWWWQKGYPLYITHMTTAGLSAPVTVPGLVAINIAEEIAIGLIIKACYGVERLYLGAMISVVDMRTMIRPYSRPEIVLGNLLISSMARYYGVGCNVQTGLADAKVPCWEAGCQKTMTTLSAILSGADTLLDAGLLSLDQVYSPIQMILDNELVGALKRIIKGSEVSGETIGFEVIKEVGPGGLFINHLHTAQYFRKEMWEPSLWSREMFNNWAEAGKRVDIDKAKEIYHTIMENAQDINELTEDEERQLLKIIHKR